MNKINKEYFEGFMELIVNSIALFSYFAMGIHFARLKTWYGNLFAVISILRGSDIIRSISEIDCPWEDEIFELRNKDEDKSKEKIKLGFDMSAKTK